MQTTNIGFKFSDYPMNKSITMIRGIRLLLYKYCTKHAGLGVSACLISGISMSGHAQISVKTNLLYDATLTPNVGVEYVVGSRSSVQLSYGMNTWTLGEGRKLRNWTLTPSYRYWWAEAGRGHYAGFLVQGGQYNMGGVSLPFGSWPALADHRYEGWFAGAALTYGYALPLGRHWRAEAQLGLGYDYFHYKQFTTPTGSELSEHKVKHYVGPNQLALNLVYVF